MAMDPGDPEISDVKNIHMSETDTSNYSISWTDEESLTNKELQGIWISELDDSLFGANKTRTKKPKCENHRRHKKAPGSLSSLTYLSMEQLRILQKVDPALEKTRELVMSNNTNGASQKFYEKDGLFYRRWMKPHCCSGDMKVEQMVLPVQCYHSLA